MNNKILICSITAVAILISVSFTSVVGYRSVASDVKASPLFNIRSSRAIDEDNKDLSCEYIGMEYIDYLLIPKRDNKSETLEILINLIKKMDDSTLPKIASLIIYHLHQRNDFQEFDSEDIFQSLTQLIDNPESAFHLIREDSKIISYPPCTYYITSCSPQWVCVIAELFLYLYGFLFGIALCGYVFITLLFNCDPNLP